MTLTDHIEALDLTLEAADGSDTITLSYATVKDLRILLLHCEYALRRSSQMAKDVLERE